ARSSSFIRSKGTDTLSSLVPPSTEGSASRSPAPFPGSRPGLDFRSKPQTRTPGPQIDRWTWHVCIPTLICADALEMTQAENPRHLVCIDQILGLHLR